MTRVALVVQRCHESLVGGSEALAWHYAELLKNHADVDVITTTALDAVSWENRLPSGSERRNGITIRRFDVDYGRTSYWHALHERLLREFEMRCRGATPLEGSRCIPWATALQEEFIAKQGPYSRRLIDYLDEYGSSYEAVFFFTYLFPTTYFGIQVTDRRRNILIPTLHDEAPAYLPVYRQMAMRARLLLWNSDAERLLSTALWGDHVGHIVGAAVNMTPFAPFRTGYPYLLYSGRIDTHKGCEELILFFARYKKDYPSDLRLIMTGKSEFNWTQAEDTEFKGFVSEEEKFRLMAGALLFVMPSAYESLSISTLEAMAQKTPILVNARSQVLLGHVTRSGGGFAYRNYEDFSRAVNELMGSNLKKEAMGKRARDYAVSHNSRERIEALLLQAIRDDKASGD